MREKERRVRRKRLINALYELLTKDYELKVTQFQIEQRGGDNYPLPKFGTEFLRLRRVFKFQPWTKESKIYEELEKVIK